MFSGRRSARKRVHPLDSHYQSLLTQVYRRHGEKMQTIGVISCGRFEGASVIAANLAIMAARSLPEMVLLVDANIANPSLAGRLAVTAEPGFVDLISGRARTPDCIRSTPIPNLKLMPAGESEGIAYDAPQVGRFFRGLKEAYGFVVVDLPPATDPSASGCVLASLLDGVVLVVESERTRSQALQLAKERLARESVHLLGAVLNKRRHHIPTWLYERV